LDRFVEAVRRDYGYGDYFDEEFGDHQAGDLDEDAGWGGGGGEVLGADLLDGGEVGSVKEVDGHADDVGEGAADLGENCLHVVEALAQLGCGVTNSDHHTVRVPGHLPGYVYDVALWLDHTLVERSPVGRPNTCRIKVSDHPLSLS